MEALIKDLEVLEDGKIKITLADNIIDWLQPVIVVDSYPANENFTLSGVQGREYSTNVSSIKFIDGVLFTGAYDDLETALRESALKANGLLNGGVSGGGGGGGNVVVTNNPDPSTATQQAQQTANLATSNTNEALIIIEELKQTAELEDIKENERRKSIGKLIDLSADLNGDWGGFPVQAASITLVVNGDNVDFQMDDVESANNKDLVQQLNNVQSLVVFDWVDGTDEIVFNGVSVSSVEVSGLLIQDNNVGALGYANFIDSVDQETGAVQQLAVLAQEQVSLTKELLRNDPVLEPAISLSYGGSTAINPTVTPDKDGKIIPLDRFGDVTIFATNNNVSYRFDGGTDFTPCKVLS